jgi:hypothetical protein
VNHETAVAASPIKLASLIEIAHDRTYLEMEKLRETKLADPPWATQHGHGAVVGF